LSKAEAILDFLFDILKPMLMTQYKLHKHIYQLNDLWMKTFVNRSDKTWVMTAYVVYILSKCGKL